MFSHPKKIFVSVLGLLCLSTLSHAGAALTPDQRTMRDAAKRKAAEDRRQVKRRRIQVAE